MPCTCLPPLVVVDVVILVVVAIRETCSTRDHRRHSSLSASKATTSSTSISFLSSFLGEDFIREQAIKFLANKIKKLVDPQNGGCDKDTEEFLLQESKKVLQDVTGEEFILFMKILSGGSCCPSCS